LRAGEFLVQFSRVSGFCAAGVVLAYAVLAPAGTVGFRNAAGFHATMPAGSSVVQLKPSGAMLSVLGLIECPEIEGLQQVSQGVRAKVVTAQGVTLHQFPQHFSFRITASLRKLILDAPDHSLITTDDPQALLLKLRFRLKIYDGLDVHEVVPDSITMIGVPAEIASDERIFRVNFDVGQIPVTDRVILQVTSPEGEDITHFSFGLL
jgi:hypothetical protein